MKQKDYQPIETATLETLVLSDRDRDLFLQALESPPRLNKTLRNALIEYQRNDGKFR